jgi:hypothetical protein
MFSNLENFYDLFNNYNCHINLHKHMDKSNWFKPLTIEFHSHCNYQNNLFYP